MALYLVAYDLDKPNQNYDAVHKQLKKWGAKRVLESTWMLDTDMKASEMRDTLTDSGSLLDSNDRLVVVKVSLLSTFGPLLDQCP